MKEKEENVPKESSIDFEIHFKVKARNYHLIYQLRKGWIPVLVLIAIKLIFWLTGKGA